MIINNMSTLSTITYNRLMANPLISKARLTGVDFEVYLTTTNLPHTYQVMISINIQEHSLYEVKKLVTLPLDTNTTNNKIDNLVKETLGNLLGLKANMILWRPLMKDLEHLLDNYTEWTIANNNNKQ